MDTGDGSNTKGNGHPVPDPISTQSNTAVPSGAPVETPSAGASAGVPVEPLIVVEAPKPIKLKLKQRAFIAALAKTGNMTAAAKKSKVSRQSHWNWLNEVDAEGNPTRHALAYREATDVAMDEAIELLEMEARRRAEKGTLKPVFFEGSVCGAIREYSDTLLIFLLKGAKPHVYRDRYEVTGAGGKPLHPEKVTVDVNLNYSEALKTLSEDELEQHNAIASKLLARSGGPTPLGTN